VQLSQAVKWPDLPRLLYNPGRSLEEGSERGNEALPVKAVELL
jgi:hypothetical protein